MGIDSVDYLDIEQKATRQLCSLWQAIHSPFRHAALMTGDRHNIQHLATGLLFFFNNQNYFRFYKLICCFYI
jgi:hypothetical protein